MSYLYRSGTGRNNIAFTNTANSSTKYLRRTASSRNSIVWTTIPQGSTYNILNRTGTGRNNISWANLSIMSQTESLARGFYSIVSKYNGHLYRADDSLGIGGYNYYLNANIGINESGGYLYAYGGSGYDLGTLSTSLAFQRSTNYSLTADDKSTLEDNYVNSLHFTKVKITGYSSYSYINDVYISAIQVASIPLGSGSYKYIYSITFRSPNYSNNIKGAFEFYFR